MEPLKNLKLDIDRIILQLLIPGIFSVLPFFLLFIESFPGAKAYFVNSEGMTTLSLFILSITAGLILEDIGSYYEVKHLDRINKKKYQELDDEWERYLKLDLPNNTDLVAQRYLRTILIRMKFELSFAFALIFMIIGLIFLNCNLHFTNWLNFFFICFLVPMTLSIYIFNEASTSSILMINTRKKILAKFEKAN